MKLQETSVIQFPVCFLVVLTINAQDFETQSLSRIGGEGKEEMWDDLVQ